MHLVWVHNLPAGTYGHDHSLVLQLLQRWLLSCWRSLRCVHATAIQQVRV